MTSINQLQGGRPGSEGRQGDRHRALAPWPEAEISAETAHYPTYFVTDLDGNLPVWVTQSRQRRTAAGPEETTRATAEGDRQRDSRQRCRRLQRDPGLRGQPFWIRATLWRSSVRVPTTRIHQDVKDRDADLVSARAELDLGFPASWKAASTTGSFRLPTTPASVAITPSPATTRFPSRTRSG